ncbi:tRNA 2-selenouridine(34) synthase MnmH [Thalassobius sp. MITS945101]|uniref:tRNA 2-selenouridine(34) synthase MnmH n=1 Tax=Thalassobius sp. MITS945101 TaxID=3096994 RepID=UPI0039998D2C
MVDRVKFSSLREIAALGFDDIIDVRAPAEYAEDHLPDAISLPVFSDAERAKVGTIYVQDDPFKARKVGAALVARNAAKHLEGPLADRSGAWRPLVYCWRGGQRSGSFASILAQIGWRVSLIDGGYKAYRRLVVQMLYDQPLPHRLVLIDGGTGTGKTDLLAVLAEQGAQVLDLEALANHRGSLLGGRDGGQPSQKAFESQLAMALAKMDPARPVLVEAESAKIGRIRIPPSVWQAMLGADHFRLEVPLAARARYLAAAYVDVIGDMEELCARLSHLAPFHGHEAVARWQMMARNGDHVALSSELVEVHYDPSYRRSSRRASDPLEVLSLTDLAAEDLQVAADRLLKQLSNA